MRFLAGAILGLLIGLTAAATAQHTTTGSGTGATPSGNLLLGTASLSLAVDPKPMITGPFSFVFVGKGPQELLRIDIDGTVTYQGRVIGTDKEIWVALRAMFNPGRVCQEWEEDLRWAKP